MTAFFDKIVEERIIFFNHLDTTMTLWFNNFCFEVYYH